MANNEHVAMINQGVDAWNKWREDNRQEIPDLSGINLSSSNLNGADLIQTNLSKANLNEANLGLASLIGANLFKANLNLANLRKADLVGAHLISADLREADLSDAYLITADLGGANLSGAKLNWADMEGVNLAKANLTHANLSYASLHRATLIGADLSEACIRRTDLRESDFTESIFGWTIIVNVSLSDVKGLRSIIHEGPSLIGIETIYNSRGEIPEPFLRGAGVPENFIEYMPQLIRNVPPFYSCFIRYSTKDQEFATRLHSDLQNNGIRCWFAREDIKGGHKLHEQIPEAIRLYDKLLLVLSENSMNSEWVKTEIYHARQYELDSGKRKLFPIALLKFDKIRKWEAFDADVGKDMAREVREYYIPDFSDWKNRDSYKKAFDGLLRDLRAEN
jgi:uncharacterized protein YjbI with pentapeptide repeats